MKLSKDIIVRVLKLLFCNTSVEHAAEPDKPEGQNFQRCRKWIENHRKLFAILIPLIFFEVNWFILAFHRNYFELYPQNYTIAIVMVIGALVAGMTSEGGGAVAFPVMTLAMHIKPSIARDFSLMIQSCGMTAASFTIIFMKVQIEWRSVIFCSLAAMVGIVIGFEFVEKNLTGAQKKMGFVSIWFAFAIALFILNLKRKRKTYRTIPNFGWWKAGVLMMTGFLGGICTSFAGSGVDICSFSILTLLFHISEKVATPTSVVLMAINTVVGFYWRTVVMEEIEAETWNYFAICVPVVVICAPLGSLVATRFHRLVLAGLIYILETIALISAFVIVKPGLKLGLVSGGIIVGGFLMFFGISRLGNLIAERNKQLEITPTTGEIENDENVAKNNTNILNLENMTHVTNMKCLK